MMFEQAVALRALGRASEAARLWVRIASAPADDLLSVAGRAWSYLEAGLYPAAVVAVNLGLGARLYPDADARLRFVRTVALCQQGICERARERLAEAPALEAATPWVHGIQAYLLRQMNADTLIGKAESTEQATEARFYVGMDLLAEGHTDAARGHLRWVTERGSDRVPEYHAGVSLYSRLTAVPEAVSQMH
jgi:hypothetical protein